jgi:hypothetical protein
MNNVLAAYRAGVSSVQEDKQVLDEIANNDNFADLLDIMDEVDAIDGMEELRNEFNENVDKIEAFEDYITNIK